MASLVVGNLPARAAGARAAEVVNGLRAPVARRKADSQGRAARGAAGAAGRVGVAGGVVPVVVVRVVRVAVVPRLEGQPAWRLPSPEARPTRGFPGTSPRSRL